MDIVDIFENFCYFKMESCIPLTHFVHFGLVLTCFQMFHNNEYRTEIWHKHANVKKRKRSNFNFIPFSKVHAMYLFVTPLVVLVLTADFFVKLCIPKATSCAE